MAQREDRPLVLTQEQGDALKGVFLQLIAYFSSQMAVQETLRNQVIKAAHVFGVSPKDITKAADLSNASVHRIISQADAPLGEVMTPYLRRMLLQLVEGAH